VKAQISSLGNNLLTLRPGAGFGSRAPSAGVPHFTEKDATIIGEQIAGIAAVAPVRTASLSTIYLQNARASTVTGTTPVYFQINKCNIAEGRFFTDADLRSGAAVCVIGNTVRTELFGNDNPIGAKIRIGKASCEVIGLLVAKGQAGMGDQDDTIIMPLSALQRRLIGKTAWIAPRSSAKSLRSCASGAISKKIRITISTSLTRARLPKRSARPRS
jgi:putative ABC transport system permease protein